MLGFNLGIHSYEERDEEEDATAERDDLLGRQIHSPAHPWIRRGGGRRGALVSIRSSIVRRSHLVIGRQSHLRAIPRGGTTSAGVETITTAAAAAASTPAAASSDEKYPLVRTRPLIHVIIRVVARTLRHSSITKKTVNCGNGTADHNDQIEQKDEM